MACRPSVLARPTRCSVRSLASAVDGGRLARNVAAGVKPPKVQRKEMHFLNAVQVEVLADAIEKPYPVLIRFPAYTGLRPCELVALKVGRLDLLRGTVRVAEAAPEVAGRLEWAGSRRTRPGPSGSPVAGRGGRRLSGRSAARTRRPDLHRTSRWIAARVEVRPLRFKPSAVEASRRIVASRTDACAQL
jgi:hypothetical protein